MKQADGDAWSAYMARLLTYYCRTSEKTSKADSKVGKLFQLQALGYGFFIADRKTHCALYV